MTDVIVWLDKLGDADVPEGAAVVECEADFLRYSMEEPRLLVRGQRLCDWASTFYSGRGLPVIETHSPIRALQRVIAGLYARVPETILILLHLCSTLTLAMVGYNAGLTLRRSPLTAIGLVIVLGAVITLVVDLDRPREGFLKVSQQPLLYLQEQIGALPSANPPK